MQTLADVLGSVINQLHAAAPTAWRQVATTVIPVTNPEELAALKARPDASVLLEGDALRVMGVVNAVLDATAPAHNDYVRELHEEITRLHERIEELDPVDEVDG